MKINVLAVLTSAAVLCVGLPSAVAGTAAALPVRSSAPTEHRAEGSRALAGDQLWVTRFDIPGTARALAVGSGGHRVYVAGTGPTVAYSAERGREVWEQGGIVGGTALAVSPDGFRLFMTGSSTVAYDAATGAELWVQPGATALGVFADGSRVFVASGETTLAYDAATGTELWATSYTFTAAALGVSPDGSKVYVTGSSPEANGYPDYATVAYDAASGAQLWDERFGRQTKTDYSNALGVSPDGSKVFVTGTSKSGPFGGYEFGTVAYDSATGNQLWAQFYGEHRDKYGSAPTALAVSPDNAKVFVTGVLVPSSRFGGGQATVAYDATTGSVLWALPESSAAGCGGDLAVGPDGSSVFVASRVGRSWRCYPGYINRRASWITSAYDTTTGATQWTQEYRRPQTNAAFALGVSPDGSKLFVTGMAGGQSGSDGYYTTVAYSTG
jgi:PQQ-like domain